MITNTDCSDTNKHETINENITNDSFDMSGNDGNNECIGYEASSIHNEKDNSNLTEDSNANENEAIIGDDDNSTGNQNTAVTDDANATAISNNACSGMSHASHKDDFYQSELNCGILIDVFGEGHADSTQNVPYI